MMIGKTSFYVAGLGSLLSIVATLVSSFSFYSSFLVWQPVLTYFSITHL